MGWVWKDDGHGDGRKAGEINKFDGSDRRSDGRCSTRKIISSQCKTEEVVPGKFIKKCEKTEQLLKDCVGRPTEVVQSNKEYSEEDVTEEMMKGSFPMQSGPFEFPGVRSDIEAIERGLNRLFEAADEMKNGIFGIFGSPHPHPHLYEPQPPSKEKACSSPGDADADGHVDLSGLAREV